jgi:predicted phage terminase large subunit-like protein
MIKKNQIALAAKHWKSQIGSYRSFPTFVKHAWRLIDTSGLQWNWFTQALTEELQNWAERKYRNLIIAVPPGSAKSLCASVLLPAWIWVKDPSVQFLCCSHNHTLSTRDNQKMRELIKSDWYQDLINREWSLKIDQDQKTRFANTKLGQRQSLGSKSGIAGFRADDIILDDPLDCNPRKPPRQEDLDSTYAWVRYILSQRVNNPKTSRTLLIAQRLYEDDPVGRLLEEEPDNWNTFYFDMEYDPTMPHRHPKDPRTKPGELLFGERFGIEEVQNRKVSLGPQQYSAQNQQQPVPLSGFIVSADDLIVIDKPEELYGQIIISWDLAFKGTEASSSVVGTVWGINTPTNINTRCFDLLHVYRERLDYVGTKAAIKNLAFRYPTHKACVIEDKANGPAVISELKAEIPTIVPFNPGTYGDKIQRLRSITPVIAQHRLRLVKANWNSPYIYEMVAARENAKHLDQVDSTTQAILFAQFGKQNKVRKLVGSW